MSNIKNKTRLKTLENYLSQRYIKLEPASESRKINKIEGI